jgi:hypothetical protein
MDNSSNLDSGSVRDVVVLPDGRAKTTDKRVAGRHRRHSVHHTCKPGDMVTLGDAQMWVTSIDGDKVNLRFWVKTDRLVLKREAKGS